jgi:RNA polymerase sigma factor (sigma-70 family)
MANAGSPNVQVREPSREQRLGGLVLRYRQPLIRYFVRKGVSSDAAEDCVQDVFLRLANTDDATIENAEAYLFTVASSVLIDRARRARTHGAGQHVPIEEFALASGEAPPDRVFEDREALMRLAAVLEELPPTTREMFLLCRLDGLSYTQIAVRYAVNVRAVERQIGRALKHLRRRFPRHA